MKNIFSIICIAGFYMQCHAQLNTIPPDQLYGELFRDVQLSHIFPDSKTFVDCIPKKNPKEILANYLAIKNDPAIRFSLKLFIEENFNLPPARPAFNYIMKEKDVAAHIKNLWSFLRREPVLTDSVKKGEEWRVGSLLPLPYPYIVPGGRFREIYYWDSYFTMLGLKESGETVMIEDMVKNFDHLIKTYGHIPNGNRNYYLSRSQPPYFSLMVELLAGIKGNEIYKTYLSSLEKEYNYWMDKTATTKHVVKMPDGSLLNRYYDRDEIPRQESYAEDAMLMMKAGNKISDAEERKRSRNLRSGAESGWDFSSRWFADGKNINTIQVNDIVPVDLNCLLYQLEKTIVKAKMLAKDEIFSNEFKKKAEKRRLAIEKYCWNSKTGFYYDYNFMTKKQSTNITAAGLYPLCFFELYPETMQVKGRGAANIIKKQLLRDGGILTTTNSTGQQWDAPNGWAPLQWMAVWGLNRSGQSELAKEIAQRWTSLIEKVYASTGRLMEKYNVENIMLEAGGGEYPTQDGFGWTNGVYLALKKLLGNKPAIGVAE